MKLFIDIPEEDYKFIKDLQSLIIGGRGSYKTIQYNVINAIKNGTPVSNGGDLISRSELKKTIENYLAKRQDVIIWETDMFNMLDNAPIVNFIISPDYVTELQNRNNELIKQLEETERPQSEWEKSHIFSCGNILRMEMDVIEHKCKNCGRWSIKWARTIPDNFCPNCGAEIKKDVAE